MFVDLIGCLELSTWKILDLFFYGCISFHETNPKKMGEISKKNQKFKKYDFAQFFIARKVN